MSALDALLGRVQANGQELELGAGLNFLGGATKNPTTGLIDIPAASGSTGKGVAAVRAIQTGSLAGWTYNGVSGTLTAPTTGALPGTWTVFDSIVTPAIGDRLEVNATDDH